MLIDEQFILHIFSSSNQEFSEKWFACFLWNVFKGLFSFNLMVSIGKIIE